MWAGVSIHLVVIVMVGGSCGGCGGCGCGCCCDCGDCGDCGDFGAGDWMMVQTDEQWALERKEKRGLTRQGYL